MDHAHLFQVYLTAEESLNELREKHVPCYGKADTLGGELLRALDRVAYRYWNDGDKVDQGYGIETCNSSYRFLYDKIRLDDGRTLPEPDYGSNDEKYEGFLVELYCVMAEYLLAHPAYFEIPNYEDSRIMNDEERRAVDEWYREEEYEGEDGE